MAVAVCIIVPTAMHAAFWISADFGMQKNPRVADIQKIRRKLEKVPPGTMLRLGGMTDCFQPLESQEQITYQTIEQLNEYGIGYLIVTKSHLAGEERYRKLMIRSWHISRSPLPVLMIKGSCL